MRISYTWLTADCQEHGYYNGRQKDIGLNVQQIPFRWIWLKFCILMYFEVLNNIEMTLQALTPLLDPVLGHNREPPRNVKR
jgi:hypothetical protein